MKKFLILFLLPLTSFSYAGLIINPYVAHEGLFIQVEPKDESTGSITAPSMGNVRLSYDASTVLQDQDGNTYPSSILPEWHKRDVFLVYEKESKKATTIRLNGTE